jgi:S-adenosylmethionine decarboxylase
MTEHFFEGAEKLLEIWFTNSNSDIGKVSSRNDLRNIPRDLVEEVLNLVNCKVLKYAQSATTDTYVLSESSMFIMRTHLILKTCGETTLLYAVQPLLDLAREYCGFDVIDQVFYSRRKFLRPELQKGPHASFEHEVAYLDTLFEGGCAYVLGRTNVDCWYLYTLDKACTRSKSDQTLEVIMTDLDPEIMKIFYQENTSSAAEATKKAGIDKLFPNAKIFDFLFDPCGYSMNGLLPDGHYFTIHITPEPGFSYVSFETNVSYGNYQELIRKVVNMFQPGKFTTTIFGDTAANSLDAHRKLFLYSDYARIDHQVVCLVDYDIIYSYYKKHPS